MIRRYLAIGTLGAILAGISLLHAAAASAQPAAAASPSPALLVLNKTDATLAIVDPASGKTVGQIATGEGPHEVVVSEDGALAFVSNYGSQTPGQTISVIDLATRTERRRVDLGGLRRPHGLYVFAGKLYFTAETNRLIGRYDPVADRVDWLFGTGQPGTHMVLVSKDGAKIFTTNIAGDSISILERGANPLAWNATVVPVGKGPEAMDLSPDGKALWTAHSRDGGVSIIDLATKQVTKTLPVGTKRSNRLKFTPDGTRVLISDYDAGELFILDAVSHQEIKRLALGKSLTGILITPDGSTAFIAASSDNQLSIVDLKTLTVTGHIATGGSPDGMAWIGR